ncbi:galactitol-1-phosphate 5-dehydrogenase [Rahnella variigena]|uniref:galactitol-1-phosphate 5-dehydrogenase n=1 Tax=Rahnella variigena TaxID=574964 RepID=UPI00244C1B78|nr:galactitol-1-phosphate 5-dehydrogenase [Rahnella variigena]MDH2895044.1 galactitol-1-phosphate 5-dehydrogenase [Rahnella variigena]
MKSVVVHTGGEMTVEDRPVPELKSSGDVLVRIAYSGLCGSDIPRIFANSSHYYPITLGHEFSGHVVSIGEDIHDLQEGDAVACVPLLPCFECEECKKAAYSQCKHYDFIGSRREGGHAEYALVSRKNLFKLPENASLLQGAFLEPITVGLHALKLAGGCQDKEVIVIGAGTIGQLIIQAASALGAKSVTAVDINPQRLALALETGASHAFNSATLSADDIRQKTQERRFNQLIIETAGTPQTVALSLDIAGPKAQVALVGTLHKDLTLNVSTFSHILRKELTLLGSWMNYSAPWPGSEWQQATQLFAEKRINLDALIGSIGAPEEFVREVTALAGKPMTGKILLDMTGS